MSEQSEPRPLLPAPQPVSEPWRVTWRSILIGLVLVPFNVYWVIAAELRYYLILTLNPLFVTPIAWLFGLVMLNLLVHRFFPKLALRTSELVVIYVMLVMSCTIATHDYLINLVSEIGWLRWFASPENQWESLIFGHLPKWLLVWDKDALKGYFQGGSSLLEEEAWRVWVRPLAFWSLFIFASCWIMMCLSTILRKAWTEDQKLSFPIVRLPLVLTSAAPGEPVFKNRLLWIGFGVAFGLSLLNELHGIFPAVPGIQIRARPIQFNNPPWNATWPWFFTWYPFAIGLCYLVPLDVSFGCWFFYLFTKLQAIIAVQLGYSVGPNFPMLMEQGIGAWCAFGIILLWGTRNHLKAFYRAAISSAKGDDADEPLSRKLAFWGLWVGIAVFFGFWVTAGMRPLLAAMMLAMYVLLSIAISRVRAEAAGQHTVWDLEPLNTFRLFDSKWLGPSNMATGALAHWFWRLNRSHIMPSQLESLKLAQENHIRLRGLTFPLLLALVVSTFVGMWAVLHVLYADGAMSKCVGFAAWTNYEAWGWLDNGLKQGWRAELSRWIAVGAAASAIGGLTWLRSRFVGFPLHPLGYCIGPGLIWLWAPFLIAWLIKRLVLRYGGLRLYRNSLPFFFGLVLGDYVAGALWSIIGLVTGLPSYQIFH